MDSRLNEKRWTKVIYGEPIVLTALAHTLHECPKHEHAFAIVPEGLVCSPMEIECLKEQGVPM